jgi:hypothetical protein
MIGAGGPCTVGGFQRTDMADSPGRLYYYMHVVENL